MLNSFVKFIVRLTQCHIFGKIPLYLSKEIATQNSFKFMSINQVIHSPIPNTYGKKISGCHIVHWVSDIKQKGVSSVRFETKIKDEFSANTQISGLR